MPETKKEKFTRVLSGEPVSWKEYALHQIHILVLAEVRDKESNKDSTYFMDLEQKLHEDMELTTEQIDSIGQIYVEWARNKGHV